MDATRKLPEEYCQAEEIDLKKNPRLVIYLNIIAFIVAPVAFVIVSIITKRYQSESLTEPTAVGAGVLIASLVGVVVFLLLHEIIHGLFFWIFTRSKPVFALTVAYAYAAAPKWFFPARQYWVIGAAPLVLLDLFALILLFWGPVEWFLPLALAFALNTGGSAGDLYILSRLQRLPPNCLVKDTGHSIHYFTRLEDRKNISHP